jgi:hypothetical protein
MPLKCVHLNNASVFIDNEATVVDASEEDSEKYTTNASKYFTIVSYLKGVSKI